MIRQTWRYKRDFGGLCHTLQMLDIVDDGFSFWWHITQKSSKDNTWWNTTMRTIRASTD